jgi:hypothetical protein
MFAKHFSPTFSSLISKIFTPITDNTASSVHNLSHNMASLQSDTQMTQKPAMGKAPRPRTCDHCGHLFKSGNELFKHIQRYKATNSCPTQTFHRFLDLPPELLLMVYEMIYEEIARGIKSDDEAQISTLIIPGYRGEWNSDEHKKLLASYRVVGKKGATVLENPLYDCGLNIQHEYFPLLQERYQWKYTQWKDFRPLQNFLVTQTRGNRAPFRKLAIEFGRMRVSDFGW